MADLMSILKITTILYLDDEEFESSHSGLDTLLFL